MKIKIKKKEAEKIMLDIQYIKNSLEWGLRDLERLKRKLKKNGIFVKI